MIYITGDIHGDPSKLSSDIFPEQKKMTKDDYVIICGDFGLIWEQKESKTEKYWLDWLEEKPFTTLFVDGNHENFSRLNSYPVKTWHNGKVHKIRPSVIHLMRGEIFEINNKKIFAFGGASSHDIRDGVLDPINDIEKIKKWKKDPFKLFRINNISWWKEELPTEEEMKNGLDNLEKHNNKVDFVITHSPTASIIAMLGAGFYDQDILTRYLEDIRIQTDYKYWFSGHMHIDKQINCQDFILYDQIIRIN